MEETSMKPEGTLETSGITATDGRMDLQSGLPSLPPGRSAQAAREVRRNSSLRQARTCYDHLAGVAGVQLLDDLLNHKWLEIAHDNKTLHPSCSLTPRGVEALGLRKIDTQGCRNGRRRFADGCLDWTERRFHLGGALGATLLQALLELGVVRRLQGTRAVVVEQPKTVWLADRHNRENGRVPVISEPVRIHGDELNKKGCISAEYQLQVSLASYSP